MEVQFSQVNILVPKSIQGNNRLGIERTYGYLEMPVEIQVLDDENVKIQEDSTDGG